MNEFDNKNPLPTDEPQNNTTDAPVADKIPVEDAAPVAEPTPTPAQNPNPNPGQYQPHGNPYGYNPQGNPQGYGYLSTLISDNKGNFSNNIVITRTYTVNYSAPRAFNRIWHIYRRTSKDYERQVV